MLSGQALVRDKTGNIVTNDRFTKDSAFKNITNRSIWRNGCAFNTYTIEQVKSSSS